MSALEGRILVTGGAGFIGSALVWALNRRGISDIVVADFPPDEAKRRNLAPLRSGSSWTRETSAGGSPPTPVPSGRSRPPSTWAPARRRPRWTSPTWPTTTRPTRPSSRPGRSPGGSGSSTPPPRRPTATARPGHGRQGREPGAAQAAQSLRGLEAALRPPRAAGGLARADRRTEVFQRVRAERGPQGRHAVGRPQGDPADPGDRTGLALQERAARLPGRGAEAGLPLREGRRRHDAPLRRGRERRRGALQHRVRRGQHVA